MALMQTDMGKMRSWIRLVYSLCAAITIGWSTPQKYIKAQKGVNKKHYLIRDLSQYAQKFATRTCAALGISLVVMKYNTGHTSNCVLDKRKSWANIIHVVITTFGKCVLIDISRYFFLLKTHNSHFSSCKPCWMPSNHEPRCLLRSYA